MIIWQICQWWKLLKPWFPKSWTPYIQQDPNKSNTQQRVFVWDNVGMLPVLTGLSYLKNEHFCSTLLLYTSVLCLLVACRFILYFFFFIHTSILNLSLGRSLTLDVAHVLCHLTCVKLKNTWTILQKNSWELPSNSINPVINSFLVFIGTINRVLLSCDIVVVDDFTGRLQ